MTKKRTPSQVGKMSRRKGKAFEQFIARLFTKATGMKWTTTRNSGRTDLRGDVWCEEFGCEPFIVECKHRNTLELPHLMANNKSLQEVIEKANQEYEEGYKEGLGTLIIIKNQSGMWVTSMGLLGFRTGGRGKEFWNGELIFYELRSLREIGDFKFDRKIMEDYGKGSQKK